MKDLLNLLVPPQNSLYRFRLWTYPHNISEEGVLFFIMEWHSGMVVQNVVCFITTNAMIPQNIHFHGKAFFLVIRRG